MIKPTLIGVVACTFASLSAFGQGRDTVVRSVGAPVHAGVATLREELSIGAVNGADEYTFGKIGDLAIGKDGSVFVFDRQSIVLRQYDAAGKYVRTLAKRGQGPGEVQWIAGMAPLADGRLAVYDNSNRRVTVFNASGTVAATWPLPAGASGGSHYFVVTDAGVPYALVKQIVIVPPDPRNPGVATTTARDVWLRLRVTDGQVMDSIVEPTMPPFAQPFRVNAVGGRGWRQMAMPFAPRRLTAFSPMGYVVSAMAERYAIDLNVPGAPVTSIRRSLAATPIPAKEREEARKRIEDGMKEVDPAWSFGGRELPTVKPYFVEMQIGLDGRVWLTREIATPPMIMSTAARGRPGGGMPTVEDPNADFTWKPTRYDVFEPAGTFVGTVEAPPKVTPILTRGDVVWAVARDDDDVEFVKRYRIVWR